jgi:flavorubredoxin
MRMMLANRTVTVIGNGSWAPVVGKLIKDKLATCKGFIYTPTDLTINSSLTEENVKVIDTIADEIKETLN